jgi:hypothetical protein
MDIDSCFFRLMLLKRRTSVHVFFFAISKLNRAIDDDP